MHFLIQTIIALIVIYIVSSIINSLIVEFVAQWLNMRGNFLRFHLIKFFAVEKPRNLGSAGRLLLWLKKKLNIASSKKDEIKNFGQLLYSHFLIKNFSQKRNNYPDYIDKKLFFGTLYDLLLKDIDEEKYETVEPDDIKVSKEIDLDVPIELSPPVKKIISNILNKSAQYENKLDKVAEEIETIYETYMERISEWYKRRMKRILFFSGLTIALLSNLDTLDLFTTFKTDSLLRNEYYTIAQQIGQLESIELQDTVKDKLTKKLVGEIIKKQDTLIVVNEAIVNNVTIGEVLAVVLPGGLNKISKSSDLQLGWKNTIEKFTPSNYYDTTKIMNGYFEMLRAWLLKIAGLLFTGIALSFGATFWFDLLKKLLHFG